jgi:hypothetical protein
VIDVTAFIIAVLSALSGGASATQPAVRLDPPPAVVAPAPIDGRCTQFEGLLAQYSPGWDVVRMSKIMYRESRCQPDAANRHSTAEGLLQILSSHCPWLASQMGETCSVSKLHDPDFTVRAGAVLWNAQGYSAWSTS